MYLCWLCHQVQGDMVKGRTLFRLPLSRSRAHRPLMNDRKRKRCTFLVNHTHHVSKMKVRLTKLTASFKPRI